jgi:hypothetical protein
MAEPADRVSSAAIGIVIVGVAGLVVVTCLSASTAPTPTTLPAGATVSLAPGGGRTIEVPPGQTTQFASGTLMPDDVIVCSGQAGVQPIPERGQSVQAPTGATIRTDYDGTVLVVCPVAASVAPGATA